MLLLGATAQRRYLRDTSHTCAHRLRITSSNTTHIICKYHLNKQGAGVRELFLISTHGTEALEQFLNAHASSTTHSPTTDNNSNKHTFHRSNSTNTSHKISWSSKLTISLLKFTDCTNIGDALRELDRRNVIKSDPFILMQSDVITNVDLRTVLELHEARKKKDNSAIMTVLLSDVGGWGYNDDTDENPNSPYDIDNNGVFCPPLRG
jgi:NDP-sugar pyrophosphorylase family protein